MPGLLESAGPGTTSTHWLPYGDPVYVPCPERFSQVVVYTACDFEIRVRRIIFFFFTICLQSTTKPVKQPRGRFPSPPPLRPVVPSCLNVLFNYRINTHCTVDISASFRRRLVSRRRGGPSRRQITRSTRPIITAGKFERATTQSVAYLGVYTWLARNAVKILFIATLNCTRVLCRYVFGYT